MTFDEKKTRQAGPPKIFDNTMRTTFLQCRRKFYWWKIRRADYLVKPAYFTFGSAWGLIKSTWLGEPGATLPPTSPEWKYAALKALHAGLSFWDNSGAIGSNLDTRENLQRLFKAYLKAYPNEPFRLVKGGAEIGWIWPLPHPSGGHSIYFLAGALDGYIEPASEAWEPWGTLPLEEKTTSVWLSDAYLMQWRFSSQVTGYLWYAKNLLGNCKGLLVSMVTKKTLGPSAQTKQFERQIETRTEEELLEFERDWWWDIQAIEQAWDRWHWPKTTDVINCIGGIGKSPCPYRGLCLSGLPPSELDPLSFPNLRIRQDKWKPWLRGSKLPKTASPRLVFERPPRQGVMEELLRRATKSRKEQRK